MRRLQYALLGSALLAGCGGADSSPVVTAAVTDSAGVRIVTSTAPSWAEGRGWSVDTIPEVVIGDERTLPSVLLVGITAARRLDRGGYLVTTADDALIRWFDRNGAEQRRAGGSGTGPGEFRDIELPGINGDTLILWDTRLERITRVTLDGNPVGTTRLSVPADAQLPDPTVTGVFGDGRLLLSGRSRALSTMPSALRRDTIPLAIAGGDGTFERLIARVPGHENVIVTGPGFVTMLPRPFGARTLVATDDNSLLVSVGDVDAVTRYGTDGTVLAEYRLDRPRRLISQAEIEQQRRRLAAQVEQLPPPIDQAVADAMAGVAVPRVYPAHDRLLVDATGAIWLREDVGPGRVNVENHRWTVLDRDGNWLGMVTTPRRTEIHQVTRDRIIGVWRDENDVEHVRVHRLSR